MGIPELRLRTPTAGLLALPWDRPLTGWTVPDVPLRDIAVGPSRHLVKFVDCDGALWAVKEMPPCIARKEYDVLGKLEELGLPAVRRAGLVHQPDFDASLLLTRYLEGSWQYRRLFRRLPPDQPKHRARLFDAMASLLVELHRHGVFWGDCSLANTLFSRDGQVLQAWLVDAETSEVHPQLSDPAGHNESFAHYGRLLPPPHKPQTTQPRRLARQHRAPRASSHLHGGAEGTPPSGCGIRSDARG